MSVFLTTVSEKHPCEGCKKIIKVGETAVKTKTSMYSESQTELYSVYYHEACWIDKRGMRK